MSKDHEDVGGSESDESEADESDSQDSDGDGDGDSGDSETANGSVSDSEVSEHPLRTDTCSSEVKRLDNFLCFKLYLL